MVKFFKTLFAERKAVLLALSSVISGLTLLADGKYDAGVPLVLSGLVMLAHLHDGGPAA